MDLCIATWLWSSKVNEAEELCFFPVDNRRRGRQSVDILRAKVDETASDAQQLWCVEDVEDGRLFSWTSNVKFGFFILHGIKMYHCDPFLYELENSDHAWPHSNYLWPHSDYHV